MQKVQLIIDKMKRNEYSLVELFELCESRAAFVRANAIRYLTKYANANKENHEITSQSIEVIYEIARKEENLIRLIGVTSIAHIAIGCLQDIGTDDAVEKANLLIANTPLPERDDLIMYLDNRHSEK